MSVCVCVCVMACEQDILSLPPPQWQQDSSKRFDQHLNEAKNTEKKIHGMAWDGMGTNLRKQNMANKKRADQRTENHTSTHNKTLNKMHNFIQQQH